MYRKPGLLLKNLPVETLESSPEPCFALSEPLDITYCNSAWDRFARENGGGAKTLRRNIISRNLLDFVAADLKGYYAELFARSRALGQPVDHDYECSSSQVFRLYRMQIYPLEPGRGFVVLNSLRVERGHDRTARDPDDAIYRDSAGLMHMCANCRRTRRAHEPEAWDWVPAHLDGELPGVSHGVCPMCLEYYYRPYMKEQKDEKGQVA